nr:MAG TPA: hypothetical protein [Caudoviricetes sp.]
MLLQDGQTGDGGGHKNIMPGGAAMGRTNKMMLIMLIGSVLCLAAIGLIARNTTWLDTEPERVENDDRLAQGGSGNGTCCQCAFGNRVANDVKQCDVGRDANCRVGDAD